MSIISSGQTLTVSSGQTVSGNIVLNGGLESVLLGGHAISTTVSSGGRETVASSGAVSGDVLKSGGTVSGATLSGGLIEIMSGGIAGSSEFDFTGAGGTLQLDDSQHFNGVISGFGVPGGIDLRDIAFGTNTTLGYTDSGGSGTLTVSDGTHTATINLLGQYTAGNFTKQTDGNGGTLITDPPLAKLASNPLVITPHS